MKTERIPMIISPLVPVVWVLALLSWIGIATASDNLDELFMEAVARGDQAGAKTLLDQGADVNVMHGRDRTALIAASWRGYLDIVKLLLERGAEINARDPQGWTALTWAARKNRLEVVRELSERGADVNVKDEQGLTVVDWVAEQCNPEILKTLIDRGAKETLMATACLGDVERARHLLGGGADANMKGPDGRTPLVSAAARGHLRLFFDSAHIWCICKCL